MDRFYKVAGHVFTLSFEDEKIDPLLSNYAPFKVDEDEGSLFRISLVPNQEEPEKESYYTTPEDAEEPRLDLFKAGGQWWVEMAPTGKMKQIAQLHANSDFSDATLSVAEGKYVRFAIDNSAMLLYAFRTACLNTLEMHSSVVRYRGKAYMFLAKSGTGKSTHSRMWLENLEDVDLMNDDNPIVRLEKGQAVCYGSPWSGKTPCYRNVSAPVGAFVLINRAKKNSAERLDIFEAYANLISSTSGLRSIESMADGLHETTAALAENVPSFKMNCLPDAEAALICCEAVAPLVCRKGTKVIPNEILLGEVGELLAEGKEVELLTKGCSMLPFIVGERDSVLLKKMDKVSVGDIVLARTGRGYVLHRVFALDGEKVTLMGDGNLKGTESCCLDDISGIVKEILKPARRVKPGKGRLWRLLRPFRRYILFIYRRLI